MTEIEKQLTDQLTGQAINTCLEMEMAFKLYSYRIIDRDAFLARVQELSKYVLEEAEKLDEKLNGTGVQHPESETD